MARAIAGEALTFAALSAAVSVAVLALSCGSDRVDRLSLDSSAARAVLWIFRAPSGDLRVVASDPATPEAIDLDVDVEVHALVYERPLSELGIERGALPLPTGAGARSLPRPFRLFAFDRTARAFRDAAEPEWLDTLRLPGLNLSRCAGAGGCLDETGVFCTLPCGETAIAEPLVPAAPDGVDAPRAASCRLGWPTREVEGVSLCAPPPLARGSPCPLGEARFFGDDGCVPIGEPCSDFPEDVDGVFVVAGGTGSTGTRNDPFGNLADAIALASVEEKTILVGDGTFAAPSTLAGASLRGRCVAGTTITGTISVTGDATFENLTVAGHLIVEDGAGLILRDTLVAPVGLVGLLVSPGADLVLERTAIRGARIALAVEGRASATEISIEANLRPLIVLATGTASIARTRIESLDGAGSIDVVGGRLHVDDLEITGACALLAARGESARATVDGLVHDAAGCELTSIVAADGATIELFSVASRATSDVALHARHGATLALNTLAFSGATVLVAEDHGAVHLSHAAASTLRATEGASITLEDVVLERAVAGLERSTLTATRTFARDWILTSSASNVRLVDLSAARPRFGLNQGSIVIERAAIELGDGADFMDLRDCSAIVRNLDARGNDGTFMRVSGSTLRLQAIEVHGVRLLRAVEQTTTDLRDVRAFDDTMGLVDAIALGDGTHLLERVLIDGGQGGLSLIGGAIVNASDLEIANMKSSAIRTSGTSSATMERLRVVHSGASETGNGQAAVDVREESRVRLCDLEVALAGDGAANALSVVEDGNAVVLRFSIAQSARGFRAVRSIGRSPRFELAEGVIRECNVGAEVPSFDDAAHVVRSVRYEANQIDIVAAD